MMSAVKTLQIRIVNPKAERLIDDLASLDLIEIDETTMLKEEVPKEETPSEWHQRWSSESRERRKQAGLPEESALTMEEIVAICKEARAEHYERNQKEAACR
jgi:hypothetical protein